MLSFHALTLQASYLLFCLVYSEVFHVPDLTYWTHFIWTCHVHIFQAWGRHLPLVFSIHNFGQCDRCILIFGFCHTWCHHEWFWLSCRWHAHSTEWWHACRILLRILGRWGQSDAFEFTGIRNSKSVNIGNPRLRRRVHHEQISKVGGIHTRLYMYPGILDLIKWTTGWWSRHSFHIIASWTKQDVPTVGVSLFNNRLSTSYTRLYWRHCLEPPRVPESIQDNNTLYNVFFLTNGKGEQSVTILNAPQISNCWKYLGRPRASYYFVNNRQESNATLHREWLLSSQRLIKGKETEWILVRYWKCK